MASEWVARLRDHLASVPPGLIKDHDAVESLLVDCWADLDGSDYESMDSSKLQGRMESVEWNPPILSFEIERHGETVVGSTRASLHEWRVDVERETTEASTSRYRQLYPQSPRWKHEPAVKTVLELIVNRVDDHRLKWNSDKTRVRIRIAEIVPSGHPDTTTSRRKRFAKAVRERLGATGWRLVERTTAHTYEPAPTS